MKAIGLFALVTLIAALAGCASYPLDIPEEEWESMGADARAEARREQAKLERAREERRIAEAAARKAEAAQRAEELAKARRTAGYGERVQCVLQDGEAYLAGNWRRIEPVALDLVEGMELEITLAEPASSGLRYHTTGYAVFDGQTIQICERPAGERRDFDGCARMLGTQRDYRRGLAERVKGEQFLRSHLRCDLVRDNDAARRLIIEDR